MSISQNVPIADKVTPHHPVPQIDALIGSDHYWQIATGKVIQRQSGPAAIHTHLGWVLSGPVCNAAEQNTLNSQVISGPQVHFLIQIAYSNNSGNWNL